MSTLADTSSEVMTSRLESLYDFRGREVRQVLAANPELIPVLEEVETIVPSFFGADTRLALEVLHDPEGGPDGELFAIIQTPLAPDSALARMQAFDEGWWLAQTPRVAGRLTVTLE